MSTPYTPVVTDLSREQLNQPIIYVGAEPVFSLKTQQVAACFHRKNLLFQEKHPSASTHFFLFITDSFLKSKELILPLITLFAADPHFKQRLFPVIMGKL